MSLWFNEDFDRLGILGEKPTPTFYFELFEFETQAYMIMTKQSWLEEDGWIFICDL